MNKLNILFKIENLLSLFCWILIILFPKFSTQNSHYIIFIICVLSTMYVYTLFIMKNNDGLQYPKGNFSSLDGVVNLFKNSKNVLGGWTHYLAFDLMVGLYIKSEATIIGIPHLIQIPCFLLTLFYGPSGLLLFFIIKLIILKI